MKYIIIFLLIVSCEKHKMHYDIGSQQLVSCNKIPFYYFKISNNNTSFYFSWKDSINDCPKSINLRKIPKGYLCEDFLSKKKRFMLKSNSEYLIEKSGMGKMSHMIKIWTDNQGNVYKTTTPDCSLPDGVPEDWIKCPPPWRKVCDFEP